jgi:hypothetical protein
MKSSRRDFLQTAGIATAVAGPAGHGPVRANPAPGCGPMGLKSRKAEAKPPTERERMEQARPS